MALSPSIMSDASDSCRCYCVNSWSAWCGSKLGVNLKGSCRCWSCGTSKCWKLNTLSADIADYQFTTLMPNLGSAWWRSCCRGIAVFLRDNIGRLARSHLGCSFGYIAGSWSHS